MCVVTAQMSTQRFVYRWVVPSDPTPAATTGFTPYALAVDFGQGVVQFGSDITMDVAVDLEMSADNAHKFWLGKLNVPLAIAKRDIKVHGSVQKVLKLAPLMQPLHEKYHQILKDAGLEEMIG